MTTLGVRLNNPGNLRPEVHMWVGRSSVSDGLYQFVEPKDGALALCKNILAFGSITGLTTLRRFITKWAPPEDNDTAVYLASVSKSTGFDSDAAFNLHNDHSLAILAEAITRREQGHDPYPRELFETAATKALDRG